MVAAMTMDPPPPSALLLPSAFPSSLGATGVAGESLSQLPATSSVAVVAADVADLSRVASSSSAARKKKGGAKTLPSPPSTAASSGAARPTKVSTVSAIASAWAAKNASSAITTAGLFGRIHRQEAPFRNDEWSQAFMSYPFRHRDGSSMGRILNKPPFPAAKCNFLVSAKHIPWGGAIETPPLSESNASAHFSEPLEGYIRFGDKGAGAAYLLTPDGRESARNNNVLFVDISDGQVRLGAVTGSVCFVC
jgi:hypothetical protein